MINFSIKNGWKIALGLLCSNALMMSSGYTMLVPFLPLYMLDELGVPIENVSMWTGAVFGITFLIGGIMAPLWGKLADSHGQKLMAVRSSIGLSISYFAMGLVTTPEQLLAVRAFQGFAAGLMAVFMAMVSSVVPKQKTGIGMGFFQSSMTLGNIVGPLLGGVLAMAVGMRASFYVAGTFLLITTIITWFFLPEPKRNAKPATESNDQRSLLKRPAFRELLVFYIFLWFMVQFIQPIFTIYIDHLHTGDENVVFLSGLIFSSIGIAGAITAPLWGKYGQSHGFYKSLGIGLLIASIFSTASSIPQTILGFGVINVIYGMIFAGVIPSSASLVACNTRVQERSLAYSYLFSAQQFGSMLGPLAGGAYTTFMPMHTIFYVSGFMLLCMGSIIIYRHHKDWFGQQAIPQPTR